MADGSTQEVGDQELSEEDVTATLIARRQEREEPKVTEDLEKQTLEEDPGTDEVIEDQDLGEDSDDDPNPDAEGDEVEGTDKFETIDEVAEAAGVELSEFLEGIKVKTLVDGQEGSVTLAELVKGHQLESSFTRKNQQWIEQKDAEQAKIESERSKLSDHFQLATTAFHLAEQQLLSDFQGIDWNQLQQTNPAEWAAKRQQFGERKARLTQAKEQTASQVRQAMEAQKTEDLAAEDQRLQAEHETLLEKVPSWKDENVRNKEAAAVAEYLSSVGFSDRDISELKDHKLVILARAALGQQGPSKKQLELAKKKVEKAPRLVKPGGARPQTNGAISAAEKATAKANRTGDESDVADALIARRKARDAKNRSRRRT